MADENEKVIIEIDAETGQFTTKVGSVETRLQGLKSSGNEMLTAWTLGVTGVNQVLEIGSKILELWNSAVENMAQTEAWKNQETALKNLGSTVGMTAGQMDALVKAVKLSTGGTVTDVKATEDAFKLLNAGFTAETIPNITRYAELLEHARGIPFEQTINAFSQAMITGNTKALMPFEISLAKTGDRMAMQQAIMAALANQTQKFGDGYVDTAQRMKTKSEEAWNSVKKFFGGKTEDTAIGMFGDELDKASVKIQVLKTHLEEVNLAMAKGQTSMPVIAGVTTEVMTTEKARAAILSQIADQQDIISKSKQTEREEEEKNLAQIKQKGELLKALSPQLAQKEALKASAAAETEFYEQGKTKATDHYAMMSKLINQEFLEKQQAIAAEPQTVAQFHARIIALEKDKYAKLHALRMSDEDFEKAKEQAKIAVITNTNLMTGNVEKTHQAAMQTFEEKRFTEAQNRLRIKGLNETQFNKQMELEEEKHQRALQAIQEQYMKLTTQNVKMGWQSAMNSMKQEWGSWASVTQKAAGQTHNIISQGFIQMAKDHKFSMDVMLSQFIGFVGETLIQKGSADLLMSIFPPNPAGMATGAAEIALGSVLVGATSSGAGASSSGVSAAAPGGGLGPTQVQPVQTAPQKGAQIIINGFLNTRQSAVAIADILRNNADVTDFSVTAQGQSWQSG